MSLRKQCFMHICQCFCHTEPFGGDYKQHVCIKPDSKETTGDLPSQEPPVTDNFPLRFALPGWPKSVNSIYQVIYSQRRVEMKPEVRAWKTKAKEFVLVPLWTLRAKEKGTLFEVHLTFIGEWLYKNGSPRKLDVQNMVKVVLDAVSEKMGWDDSRIWSLSVDKNSGDPERVEVEINFFHE